jgi:hypothetical protein
MKRRVWAAGLLLALLGASTAQAFPFLDDPGVVLALRRVAELLDAIHQAELVAHLRLQRSIRGVVRQLGFPTELFEAIGATLGSMKGIRREIEEMACSWPLSSRTLRLRDLYLSSRALCRPDVQLLWGSSEGRADEGLGEFRDYMSALSLNMAGTRAGAVAHWEDIFPGMEKASAQLRSSPGEANRDGAVALAGAGVVASSNSALETQELLVSELERTWERREERQRGNMGQFLLLSAAGKDPWAEGALREADR